MTTVLLVEDELDIAEVLRDVLEIHGFRVILAVDGVDGLEKAHGNALDLLITDVMMPAMDGAELIERVRQIRGLERVPVIAISAAPYEGDELFLRKPFDVHEFVQLIRRALAGSAAQYRKSFP